MGGEAAKKPGFFGSLAKGVKNIFDPSTEKEQAHPGDTDGLPPMLGESAPSQIVSQRLMRLPSRVHAPRINSKVNGAQFLPSSNSFAGAAPGLALPGFDGGDDSRSRLLVTLAAYDLTERVVKGDGACQFRALSDQLYGTETHHSAVRERIVTQLRRNNQRYSGFVPSDFGSYCDAMAKESEWGDHVTLQAAADAFCLRIMVLTSYETEFVIKIEPLKVASERVLWVSFWAEVHYNSLSAADM
ncbi:hypothetical protein FOA52_007840 [Chlamydomonas sp. UWO 241]|nr:hypothetical protein FOA52_007840 [Chlamydomonas sp. UWO 241]